MALTVGYSATIDVDTDPQVITLEKNERRLQETAYRGTIILVSGSRVYIGFNKEAVNANDLQEVDKVWLDSTQVVAIRVPSSCNVFVLRCGAGSAKCFYVEN